MKVIVRYFASIKDYTGIKRETLVLEDEKTIGELLILLKSRYGFESSPIISVVNREYVKPERNLHEGDIIALFPPVSGG